MLYMVHNAKKERMNARGCSTVSARSIMSFIQMRVLVRASKSIFFLLTFDQLHHLVAFMLITDGVELLDNRSA